MSPPLRPPSPAFTAHLLRPLLTELLDVLGRLGAEQWEAPTIAGSWRVRDAAAHLLDGDLRKLAAYRDGHFVAPSSPIVTDGDLARFVNALNAGGVTWGQRLSTRLVADLLAVTGEWVADLLESLPRHEPSIRPVSWAGEAVAENWMGVGREYTECWHHQMQIRGAVGAPLLLGARWYRPLLDVSVRALPTSYAGVGAERGTAVVLAVAAEDAHDAAPGRDRDAIGAWSLVRESGTWALYQGAATDAACVVRATADAAWRLLYNALPEPTAAGGVTVGGDRRLAEPLLRTRPVIV